MKLEFKHIAPYLPYCLAFLMSDKKTILKMSGLLEDNLFVNDGFNYTVVIKTSKPILRPISEFGDSDDLRKVQEFIGLGKWCEAYDHYFESWFNDARSIKKLVLQAPQEIFNYFLANHYDVFGLIPAGLAVSIHDVGKVVA